MGQLRRQPITGLDAAATAQDGGVHLLGADSTFLSFLQRRNTSLKPAVGSETTSNSGTGAHSNLVDETEAVSLHGLLPLQLHVDAGSRLGFGPRLGQLFGSGRVLLGKVRDGVPARVFAHQVAHLAGSGGLVVDKGAEPTHPLWSRRTSSNTTKPNGGDQQGAAVRQTCLLDSAD